MDDVFVRAEYVNVPVIPDFGTGYVVRSVAHANTLLPSRNVLYDPVDTFDNTSVFNPSYAMVDARF